MLLMEMTATLHFAEIQAIAEKARRPVSEVAAYYEEVLERMAATATVTNFLAVLVSKKVREHYRRKQQPIELPL